MLINSTNKAEYLGATESSACFNVMIAHDNIHAILTTHTTTFEFSRYKQLLSEYTESGNFSTRNIFAEFHQFGNVVS